MPRIDQPYCGAGIIVACLFCQSLANAAAQFEDTTQAAGVSHAGPTAGASWGDVNGDGWPDLWVGNHSFEKAAPRLYVNNGDGTFTNRSHIVDVPDDADLHGAAWADFDDDGDQDLIVQAGGGGGQGASANVLLINDGGYLRDRAREMGVDDPAARGRTPLWIDANNDGKLDLLLSNMPRPDGQGSTQLLLQHNGRFEPLHPPVDFAPTPRSFWAQAFYVFGNLLDYRAQSTFGAIRLSDQFAQVGDVDSDGLTELIAYGNPTYIYDLNGQQPELKTTSLLGTLKQVGDIAMADFDGNLSIDFYVARSRDASPDIVQPDSHTLRAHLLAANNSSSQKIAFSSRAALTIEIVDPWEITDKLPPVFIGAARKSPETLKFQVDPEDPALAGVPQHTAGTAEILLEYDNQAGIWTVHNWAGRINIEIHSAGGPLTNLQPINFTPRKGDVPDRLLLQNHGSFETIAVSADDRFKANCSSVVAEDFDNDMDVDVYLACAEPAANAPNVLLENLGAGEFRPVTGTFGARGTDLGRSDVVTTVDYDSDGFIDLFVTNGRRSRPFSDNGPYQLFRNMGNGNHWLQVDLQGVLSNRAGIGATVRIFAGGRWQIRQQTGGIHSFAQNQTRLHFGLAEHEIIEQIEVSWPSGRKQVLQQIEADQILKIVEPDSL